MRKGTLGLVCLLLALCLVAAGCRRPEPPPEEPDAPPAASPVPNVPARKPETIALDHLTVELVMDWQAADGMLSRLEELSRLLEQALLSQDCSVEEPVVITIGTAAGVTAQALGDGGVDAAFLPAADFAAMEEGAAAGVLMNADQDFFLAVTAARPELDEAFRFAMEEALTNTEDGRAFLEICYPGMVFVCAEERSTELPLSP